MGLDEDVIRFPTTPLGVGTQENEDIAWAIQLALKKLADTIYDLCTESEEERCEKVLKDCRQKCLDIFVDDPDSLPGVGSDLQGRQRRCIRECMESESCFDF